MHMRIAVAFSTLVLLAGTTAAQPSIPGPYEYGTQVAAHDRDIIEHGDIATGRVIGATLAAGFVGYGAGQAIEGRYGERGWMFTVADTASGSILLVGLMGAVSSCDGEPRCHHDLAVGLAIGGAAVFLGSRAWQVVDAALAPAAQNARYRAAVARNPGYVEAKVLPYLVPSAAGQGAVAGVSLRF
jgi:MFS family permease